jgi:hypothetical protein
MVRSKLLKMPRSQDATHAIVIGSTLVAGLTVLVALLISA